MTEPTDEMERAFEDAADPCCHCGDTRAGLAAVLAIVERDWKMQPNPARRAPGYMEPGMCRCRPGEGQHEFGVEGCRGFES